MDIDDRQLLTSLKKGEERAYDILYAHHYSVLCSYADYIVKDSFIAESLVNDVFFHIWEIRDSLNVSSSLRSYLVTAVRNKCLDYLNLNRVKKETSLDTIVEEPPFGDLLDKELESEMMAAIEALPEPGRTVFRKSRFEDKKYSEIAAEMDISINTVKYHIKHALAILAESMSNYLK